jgi:hypothetical protein
MRAMWDLVDGVIEGGWGRWDRRLRGSSEGIGRGDLQLIGTQCPIRGWLINENAIIRWVYSDPRTLQSTVTTSSVSSIFEPCKRQSLHKESHTATKNQNKSSDDTDKDDRPRWEWRRADAILRLVFIGAPITVWGAGAFQTILGTWVTTGGIEVLTLLTDTCGSNQLNIPTVDTLSADGIGKAGKAGEGTWNACGVFKVLTLLTVTGFPNQLKAIFVGALSADGWRETGRAGEGTREAETGVVGVVLEIVPLHAGKAYGGIVEAECAVGRTLLTCWVQWEVLAFLTLPSHLQCAVVFGDVDYGISRSTQWEGGDSQLDDLPIQ